MSTEIFNEEQPLPGGSGKTTADLTMRLIDSKTGETITVCTGNLPKTNTQNK